MSTKTTIPWAAILKEFNSVPAEKDYLKNFICNASPTFEKVWRKSENRLEIIKHAKIFLETYSDKTILVEEKNGLVLFLRYEKPWDDLPEVRQDFLNYIVEKSKSAQQLNKTIKP